MDMGLSPDAWHAVWLSVKVAALTAPAYVLAAVVLAYALQFGLRRSAWLDALMTVPLVFPPVVIGFAPLRLLGRESPVGQALHALGVNLVFTLPGLWLTPFIVGLPLAGGLALAMVRGLGEVGISLMLGGDIIGRTETLSLTIFNAVMNGNNADGGWLSAPLGVASLLLFLGVRAYQNRELAKHDVLHPR